MFGKRIKSLELVYGSTKVWARGPSASCRPLQRVWSCSAHAVPLAPQTNCARLVVLHACMQGLLAQGDPRLSPAVSPTVVQNVVNDELLLLSACADTGGRTIVIVAMWAVCIRAIAAVPWLVISIVRPLVAGGVGGSAVSGITAAEDDLTFSITLNEGKVVSRFHAGPLGHRALSYPHRPQHCLHQWILQPDSRPPWHPAGNRPQQLQ